MLKFYYKFQNKMLVSNLLSSVILIVVILNIVLQAMPRTFIKVIAAQGEKTSPMDLFTYCDGYLLFAFVILLLFFIGTDFNNSMEDLGKISGGWKHNKFFIKKIVATLAIYFIVYVLTFANVYSLYMRLGLIEKLIPLKEILFYSFVTNLFVISLSLFILFLTRNILISTVILSFVYMVEEVVWRGNFMGTKGILGHVYSYEFYRKIGDVYQVKFVYIIISIILILITLNMSKIRSLTRRVIGK